MKKTMVYLLSFLLIITAISIYFSKINLSLSADTVLDEDSKRKILIDTALSYYRKGESYQYDLVRENRFLSPESINEYNTSYAVCSTFVYQVYYNALGVKIPIKTSNHLKNARSIINNYTDYTNYLIYYDKDSFNTKYNGNLQMYINEIYNSVKIGDIIVFGFGKNGHTTMVYNKEIDSKTNTKKIYLIHNNGEPYSVSNTIKDLHDNYENNGSISIVDLKEIITRSYCSNNMLSINEIAIFRMIDGKNLLTFNNLKPSLVELPDYSPGETRYKYEKMDYGKTYSIIKDDCSTTKSLYADLNEYIEYSIKIKNNSDNDYNKMTINEKIDTSKVEYISSNYDNTYKNGNIKFTINVKKNSSVIIKYKVRVLNNEKLIGSTISSTGNIDSDLKTKEIKVFIGHTLSNIQQTEIINKYKKIDYNTNDNTGKDYVKKLYKQLFNYNLNLDNDVIKYEKNNNLLVKNTKVINNSNIVLGNMYGLNLGCSSEEACYDIEDKNKISPYNAWRYWNNTGGVNDEESSLGEYNNRPRTLKKEMFETGDIILSNGIAFIYIDGKIINNATIHYEVKIDEYLRNLVGKNYVVLRPALSNSITKKTYTINYVVNESDVTDIPEPTKYTYSKDDKCITNISKMVPKRRGYTFAGWMMSSNNSIVWNSGVNWKKSNASNYTLIGTWKANTYSISYDLNGGKDKIEKTTYTYSEEGTISITSVIPEKEGYTFLGWSRNKDDEKAMYKSSTLWKKSNAGNYTLYAIWKKTEDVISGNDVVEPDDDNSDEPIVIVIDDTPDDNKDNNKDKNKDKGKDKNNNTTNEEEIIPDDINEENENHEEEVNNKDNNIKTNNNSLIYIGIAICLLIISIILIIKKKRISN